MEKRVFERYLSAAGIALYFDSGDFLCNGTIMNISKGGMLVTFLDTGRLDTLDQKKRIKFQVQIPTGTIIGICEVVWTDPIDSHVGLRFTKVEHEGGIVNLLEHVTGAASSVSL